MDESNTLPPWIRLSLIGVGLFLAGGLLSFGYSYRPLHGSMTWKIAELEQRIDDRNLENQRLNDELVRLRSMEASRIDPESFSQVEGELSTTKKALAQAEKDLKRTDRKRKDANASANRWRKRFEELRDQHANAAPAATTPPPEALPSAASTAPGGPDASGLGTPDSQENPGSQPTGESGMLPSDPTRTAPSLFPSR